jgi:hypothetical protein
METERATSASVSELRSTGGGARRAVAWSELEGRRLEPAQRRVVGASWRERMRQEHLAVGAFTLLARELAEEGCSTGILSLVTRASADEVRHAEICRRFAVRLLGEDEVPKGFRGLANVPMHPDARPAERVLFHVTEMCCLSETLTGVYLTEMLARTTDEVARTAIESLLEDEVDHGRVGWAYLAERARQRHTGGLAEALPAMIDRVFGRVLRMGRVGRVAGDDLELESCGYLGLGAAIELYEDALRRVILPGFETLNVDLGPTRTLLRDCGWVA